MRQIDPLTNFMSGIAGDVRIGSTHIALFVAVYDLWLKKEKTESLDIQPKQLMKRAKILARSTYVRTIRDLGKWGYLVYEPSYNNKSTSRVRIKTENNGNGNS